LPSLNSSYWFAPGKWVLSGEHTVLRNGPAIALPKADLGFHLYFEADTRISDLQIQPLSAENFVRKTLCILDQELKKIRTDWKMPDTRGILKLESNIPQGGGLGSSAALCVALTRWYAESANLSETETIEIATKLENQFHGQSSGMDVAVILLNQPIIFKKGPKYEKLSLSRLPPFQFFDTGLRSKTLECIERVERLRNLNPDFAEQIDQKMIQSTQKQIELLRKYNQSAESETLLKIAESMNEAQSCFYDWGLIPDRIKEMETELRKKGALGVKITGAGNGGYLVALFPQTTLEKNPNSQPVFGN
jgi:mevalonate kinase